MYERVMAIVPYTGHGTHADPKRPMYAPTATAVSPAGRAGIIGYTCVPSDDGKVALCEFVAHDRSAFGSILTDPTVKSFLKGVNSSAEAEALFKQFKKDFDINKFGVNIQ